MNTANHRLPLTVTLIAALSASLLTVGLARADDAAASKQTGNQTDAKVIDIPPAQQQAALDAMQSIDAARGLIAKSDLKAALGSVEKADSLLQSVADALPTAKAKKALADARDKANAENPDWVSIDETLDETALFMPVKTAKSKVDAAKSASEKGDPQAAKQALEEALVSIQYSEVDLPLTSTLNLVQKARAALEKNDVKTADTDLQAAAQGVIYLSTAIDQPLYLAHGSLWQSLVNLKNGAETDAKKYLDAALNHLRQAAKSTDKAVSEAASSLLAEGKALRGDMDKPAAANNAQPGNSPDATQVSSLEALGQRTEAWMERATNFAHEQFASLKSNSPLKTDLIEARFHIQSTDIEQTTAHAPDAARAELEQAQNYLGKAMRESDEYWTDMLYKQQISGMRESVGMLLKSPDQIPATVDAGQLGDLQRELQMVIHSL